MLPAESNKCTIRAKEPLLPPMAYGGTPTLGSERFSSLFTKKATKSNTSWLTNGTNSSPTNLLYLNWPTPLPSSVVLSFTLSTEAETSQLKPEDYTANDGKFSNLVTVYGETLISGFKNGCISSTSSKAKLSEGKEPTNMVTKANQIEPIVLSDRLCLDIAQSSAPTMEPKTLLLMFRISMLRVLEGSSRTIGKFR